ncbi:DUF6167 family protein [Nocardioides panacisoli]|uniref:YtxH domain-containing protein n=1 Tax=Nocardioides panacisoli TaxID=627624 RepID=A0ABP7J0F7_9ACTN
MIGRGVWFAAGAAAGVYAAVKVRRLAESFTPDGIHDRINALGLGARMMREEFAQGAADAEAGIRQRYATAAEEHKALENGERK